MLSPPNNYLHSPSVSICVIGAAVELLDDSNGNNLKRLHGKKEQNIPTSLHKSSLQLMTVSMHI